MSDHSRHAESPPPDPLAVALSKLDPAPHGFDRDALMFAAGRESKGRALAFWKWFACAVLTVAAALAVLEFIAPPRGQVIEQPVRLK